MEMYFFFIILFYLFVVKGVSENKKSNVSESATERQQLIDVGAWTGGICDTENHDRHKRSSRR